MDADDLGARAERIIGTGQICDRCGATLYTYNDACTAMLDDPCPGFLAVEAGIQKAQADVGSAYPNPERTK